jgi:hypothetical protein
MGTLTDLEDEAWERGDLWEPLEPVFWCDCGAGCGVCAPATEPRDAEDGEPW